MTYLRKLLNLFRDAVYAFAYALENLRQDSCQQEAGLCDKMRLDFICLHQMLILHCPPLPHTF